MTLQDAAYYEPDADQPGRFASTELTRGPWDHRFQHAGPPSALMARAVERCASSVPMQLARLSVELLRPIPIAALDVVAEVVRPGRKVELVVATLSASGQELARATGLRMRIAEIDLPELPREGLPFAGPDQSAAFEFPFFNARVGYHTSMELRHARGTFGKGATAMWFRLRVAIVAGEVPTPIERVLAAADSGNGISAVLDYKRYLFINPDLTVYLHRLPVGDWVCLDARTKPEPNGIGLTDTRLYDERGPIGRGCQSLLVDRRSQPQHE